MLPQNRNKLLYVDYVRAFCHCYNLLLFYSRNLYSENAVSWSLLQNDPSHKNSFAAYMSEWVNDGLYMNAVCARIQMYTDVPVPCNN